MKSKFKLAIAVAVFSAFGSAAIATPNASGSMPAHEGPSVSIPAPEIAFIPTGIKTSTGEVFAGPAYGNLGTGRHGTFIRQPPGFVSPNHTHTEDYYAVVVKGVIVNTQTGGKEIRLPAGSYYFQRGEEDHVTKCVSETECLFFIVQPGKFDLVQSKQN
jgi:hypothetical protein